METRINVQIKELEKSVMHLYDIAIKENISLDLRREIVLLRSRLYSFHKQTELNVEAKELEIIKKEVIEIKKRIEQLRIDIEKPGEISNTNNKEEIELVREHYLRIEPQLPMLVTAKNISKSYGKDNFTLQYLDLSIRAGEINGIVGANGNGKTTLLKIISGILKQDTGEIIYHDLITNNQNYDYWGGVKTKVAYLPQDIPVDNGTVMQNLQLAASLHGLLGEENNTWVDYYLHRFELWNDKGKQIRELAGGQRLRYALAKILIGNPQLIVLDEPLANLDVNMKTTLLNDLRTLADSAFSPVGIIISSHDLIELEKVADKMLVLENGKVKYKGYTSDIWKDENQNVFEVECSLKYFELVKRMKGLENVRIDSRITSYILYTPLNISAKELLTYFLNNEIIPESFVDISHSSKRMIIKSA